MYFGLSYCAHVLKQVHVSERFCIVVPPAIMLITQVNGYSV